MLPNLDAVCGYITPNFRPHLTFQHPLYSPKKSALRSFISLNVKYWGYLVEDLSNDY